ncbi:MAG: sulfite exporter TauE/SafE family protein [Planctomycetaceae bacterium]
MEIGTIDAAQLPLVLLGGLLGSSHCIGMCGGFAMAVGFGSKTLRSNVTRQLTWSVGRIFTYSFGGAMCGFLGARLSGQFSFASIQGVLAIAAGVLLVIQGLLSTGFFKRKLKIGKGCSISKFSWLLPIGRLMKPSPDETRTGSRLGETFLAGVMTGFLPCGLVYAYLALAAATASLWWGLATMVAFGLGTVPIMVATGAGMSLMSIPARTRLFKVAAWCVLITGLLTIGRGAAAINVPAEQETPSCPLCDEPPTVPLLNSQVPLLDPAASNQPSSSEESP